jgi:dTDP-4-amino-4,6-dideoxygalactose transaminase
VSSLPLVDLAALHRELGAELEAAVLAVIRSHEFVGGRPIALFEEALADYLGAAEVVAMANGTDALELAIRGLGIEPGAEVLVPANTFIATAEAVIAAGAVPRFVDVHDQSGLIDVSSCEQHMSSRTRAVIPVHMYGRMVEMAQLEAFAAHHGLAVIEDAAQAHGARRHGRMAGTVGDIGCFSFYPGKNLGAFGDAGAAVTNDPRLGERLRLMRDHGRSGRNTHELIGFNSRMDPLQAAVLAVKLPHLDGWNQRRREAAEGYRELLPSHMLDWTSDDPATDVHHLFPIMTEDRSALAKRLNDAGVQTGIHYPRTVPDTPAFAAFAGAFPSAEWRASRQLSLPMHPHLVRTDVEFIASIVGSFLMAELA